MNIQSFPGNSSSADWGNALAKGIGSGIQALAEKKLSKMQKEHDAKEIMDAFPGVSHEAALYYAGRPEKERLEYLQGHQIQEPQQSQQPQQQSGFQQLAGQQPEQQMMEQQEQAPRMNGLEALNQVPGNQAPAASLDQFTPEIKAALEKFLSSPQGMQNLQGKSPQEIQKLQQFLSQPMPQEQQQPQQQPEQIQQQVQPLMRQGEEIQERAPRTAIGKALTPAQQEANEIKRQNLQLKTEAQNAKFLTPMNEVISSGRHRLKLAQEAIDMIETGETPSGLSGLIPTNISSIIYEKAGPLDAKIAELANTKALKLRGPVGAAKIEAANREKVKPTWSIPEQFQKLKEEKRDAQSEILWEDAYSDVLNQYGGVQPHDIETKVRKRRNDILDTPPPIPTDAVKGEKGPDKYGQIWMYTGKGMKKIQGV